MQKLNDCNSIYTLLNGKDFPIFIKYQFELENKNEIGAIYSEFMLKRSVIEVSKTHNLSISEINQMLRKNSSKIGIYFQRFFAVLIDGKVIGEYYHKGIDVEGKDKKIYSCKYVNLDCSSLYFSQKKDLNNERKEAIKRGCNYYLVLLNPSWDLSVIIREINPYDFDKISIRKKEIF